jgi:atypical dual specificity phosphatase
MVSSSAAEFNAGSRGSSSSTAFGGLIAMPVTFAGRFVVGLAFSTVLTYVLFQKKMLPKPVSKVVSRMFFLPTFPVTALLRLGNYWTVVDESVYLGCAPMAIAGHPEKMQKMGVRGVINMCYEYAGPKDAYAALGMRQLHLPVVDHFEPSLAQLQEAVAFIQVRPPPLSRSPYDTRAPVFF